VTPSPARDLPTGSVSLLRHRVERACCLLVCGDWNEKPCPACGSAAISERPGRTTQGYRRYRCGICGKQFNERSVGVLNRTQYPSDVFALVVFWRLLFLTCRLIFSYEAVRDWEPR
jgi:hypothetical protein